MSKTRLYIVTPFVDGGDLGQVIKNNPDWEDSRMPESAAKFYAACLVFGLRYLHSNNIMHRDLKLENLMIRSDGYLCLIDFGLAKFLY